MRRKISLYIGDQPADLDNQSFVLFNYTMDDLTNPTIVKNSFSQQVTLKGTPNNNRIFGSYYRTDRETDYSGETGTGFSAARKTPFTIYNERNEILESGYVKLDSVSRKGADVQYKVTLYGGLGSFFYALSYDDNGNKRTLADLTYLDTGNPDSELDFIINAASVQEAWDRLQDDPDADEMWDVINFAPAYNGIPDNNFSPDKGLVVPSQVGLQDRIVKDGKTYDIRNGYALVSLAEAQDEWAVKDLRSYLQRPVFSMKAFWKAICNPANNGGYEVDADVLEFARFGSYSSLWLTLPMIPSLTAFREKSAAGELSLTMTSLPTTGNEVARYDIVGIVSSGTDITANINCNLRFNAPTAADHYDPLRTYAAKSSTPGSGAKGKFSILFVQAVAYGSDDTIVGGSRIKIIGSVDRKSGADTAAACGFVPAWDADYEKMEDKPFDRIASGVYSLGELGFQVTAKSVAYYKILVNEYHGTWIMKAGKPTRYTYTGDGLTSIPTMYYTYDLSFVPYSAVIVQGAEPNTITCSSNDSLRSGAVITKAMLLSTSHTPAEYMLSFCKVFGLYLTYDNATRKVTILRRNDLYQDETIDLTSRVDVSQGVDIQPMVFQAKWYDFLLEGAGGAFYDEYLDVEGTEYGIQRVNTGYDFNADSVNLMESVVFKNACTILAKSKYFNYIFNGAVFQPSPFVDKGNTYTLWSADGETLETDISCPPLSSTITYYNDNPAYAGYDINEAAKLELRDAENKPVSGEDILVFHEGWNQYDYFKLTDDVPAMDIVNDGVPCWLLDAGGVFPYVPIFQRYRYRSYNNVNESLDFGNPRQLAIPGAYIAPGSTIYERAWKSYISDRYDADTKVMTCRVDFSGIPVTQDLLRKFYWYDNSLWVLNAIRNYSLTTYDPVECEFVQVRDKDNYLNGQDFD